MLFDINGGEFLVILLVAVIVIGPSRLPRYAEQLAKLTRRARALIQDTRTRVDAELGDEVKDIDWAALDPRRYDPRRIVRDALLDPASEGAAAPARPTAARPVAGAAATAAAAQAAQGVGASPPSGAPAPWDDEAT